MVTFCNGQDKINVKNTNKIHFSLKYSCVTLHVNVNAMSPFNEVINYALTLFTSDINTIYRTKNLFIEFQLNRVM
jgi:hypothetical protein